MIRPAIASALLSLAIACSPAIGAESPESFYHGKQMQFIMGFGPGTGFDSYARLIVRHIVKHLPGSPTMILQYMPGGGGLTAINYVVNIAPRDGTVIAMPNPVAITVPLIYPQRVQFDPTKFNWIGSMNDEISTCAFWSDGLNRFEDLKNPQRQIIVGGTGATSGTTIEAQVLQGTLGLNFRVIAGYHVFADLLLAVQQGEIDGMCGLKVSVIKSELADQFKSGKMKILLQAGVAKSSYLPGVPNAFDLVKDDASKQLLLLFEGPWAFGRPLMAPPGVPEDRVTALRTAFSEMLEDPEFKADVAKANLEMQPMAWDKIAALVSKINETPASVITRAKELLHD